VGKARDRPSLLIMGHALVGNEMNQFEIGRRQAHRLQRTDQRTGGGTSGTDEDMAARRDACDGLLGTGNSILPARQSRIGT